jgi:hypothetical protein
VEDGETQSFLVREECEAGEESLWIGVAAKGKKRSRPLPTKAIDEAVGERGFRPSGARIFGKDGRARSMSG